MKTITMTEEQLKDFAFNAWCYSEMRRHCPLAYQTTFSQWWERSKLSVSNAVSPQSTPVSSSPKNFVIVDCFPNCTSPRHQIVNVREKHWHNSNFQLGNIVKVVDGSYNHEKRTGKDRPGIDPLFTRSNAVVISNTENLQITYRVGNDLHVVTLDLLLHFPSGEQIHCASCCVR